MANTINTTINKMKRFAEYTLDFVEALKLADEGYLIQGEYQSPNMFIAARKSPETDKINKVDKTDIHVIRLFEVNSKNKAITVISDKGKLSINQYTYTQKFRIITPKELNITPQQILNMNIIQAPNSQNYYPLTFIEAIQVLVEGGVVQPSNFNWNQFLEISISDDGTHPEGISVVTFHKEPVENPKGNGLTHYTEYRKIKSNEFKDYQNIRFREVYKLTEEHLKIQDVNTFFDLN